ncbi:MAG: DUF4157 domain-containing protein [Myxococcales bacterium]|nr:DUF4157 domain-containing protein [Myxococcales bacterium]
MAYDQGRGHAHDDHDRGSAGGPAPGKRHRTDGLAPNRRKPAPTSDATAPAAAPATAARADLASDDPFGLHTIMRKAETGAPDDRGAAAAGAIASKGAGEALPGPVRDHFGAAYGTDLASVRVHTDRDAQQATEASGARAFAYGTDLFFASGQYDPGSSRGQFLLGHELAHVAQQGGQAAPAPQAKGLSTSDDPAERQADAAAHAALETGQAGDAHEVEASAAASAALAGRRATLSSSGPVVRFFAQDEGEPGHGGHALLTETALHKMGGLSDGEVRTAREGNWERDLSQLLIPGSAALNLTAPDQPIMAVLNLIAISDFGRGVNLREFGTYDPVEHIDNPTGLRASGVIDQGGVDGMPASHPDGANPDNAATISGPDATVHAAGADDEAYADRDERYGHTSHAADGEIHNASDAAAFRVDDTAIPAYIYTSRDWCTQTLRNAARLGRQRDVRLADGRPSPETLHGPRMFSSGVHTLQDYFAHSNFCEIAINILIREGGLTVATETRERRDEDNHRIVEAAARADLGTVSGVGGRVLDSHVRRSADDGAVDPANLTIDGARGHREVLTTGSFNFTDTVDSLGEELSAKWRALDPFRVKPEEPSPLALAAMDYIELNPNNACDFSGAGGQLADLIHPAIATISGLGGAGATVVEGTGALAASGVRGLTALGSGALDALGSGLDVVRGHTGVGGDAAAALHGGARAVTAEGTAAAGHVTGAAGGAADAVRGLVTQLQAQEAALRVRQHTLRELYAFAYGHGPLDLLKAAARDIPVIGGVAAAAIEGVQRGWHAAIETLLGGLWNLALAAGTSLLNAFIAEVRGHTNVSENRAPVADGPFRAERQAVADFFGNVSDFYEGGRPRVESSDPATDGEHYSGIAPASYTPPSHSEIAKDHGDIENRPGEEHAHAEGGHVEAGNWLNGLAMALAQRATIGVGQPVEACWDRVDGGETIGPADPMLDQITARVNLYFDHPEANRPFWEQTVRDFVGGALGPELIEHLRSAEGGAPDAPGPLVDIPITHPAAGPTSP